MSDDRLVRLLNEWDDISWITKRQIDWIIIKAKIQKNHHVVASIITALAMISVIISEDVESHLLILSITALLHFYIVFADKLVTSS